MKTLAVAATAAALAFAGAVQAATVYSETFEDGTANGFSGYTNVVTAPNASTKFLGQMDLNETGVLGVDLTGYSGVQLQFDLYAIQSLDGAPNGNAPDNFIVKQGATVLFDFTFGNVFNQSYPNGGNNPAQTGAIATSTLGFGNYFGTDSTYRITLNLTGGSLANLSFIGSSDQGESDESFGVDNILITGNRVSGPGPIPEPATWAMMILGFGAAGTALRRRRTLTA